MNSTNPNMNTNANGFEQNVKNALKFADEVIQSVNASLAIATSTNTLIPPTNVLIPSTNVLPSEKNVKAILDDLESAAVAPTQAALNQPSIEATGKEVKKIMSEGFNEFKRQTGRNMTYSEMRYAYG